MIKKFFKCKEKYDNDPGRRCGRRCVTNHMICASELNVDSCNGDSGGPLIAGVNGEYVLVGIVSFGKKCASRNFPGVYTEVADFIDFITPHL